MRSAGVGSLTRALLCADSLTAEELSAWGVVDATVADAAAFAAAQPPPAPAVAAAEAAEWALLARLAQLERGGAGVECALWRF